MTDTQEPTGRAVEADGLGAWLPLCLAAPLPGLLRLLLL